MLQRPDSRGSATIEFALLTPVLMLFISGTMEYSWMFFHRTAVQVAGRTACRHGATLNTVDHDIEAEVTTLAIESLEALTVDCTAADCDVDVTFKGTAPNQRLRCALSVKHRPLTGSVPTPERLTAGYLYILEIQQPPPPFANAGAAGAPTSSSLASCRPFSSLCCSGSSSTG